jgi:holo-[acyl-carrier protein] synthase
MIIGLGTDIVRVSRIENLQKKYGDKFLNRILTAEEQKKFHSLKLEEQKKYLAKRFAAKEAFVKALGLGFNDEISFQDISVVNDKHGKPYYNITNKLDLYIKKLFKITRYSINISISDDTDYANAIAIIEKLD